MAGCKEQKLCIPNLTAHMQKIKRCKTGLSCSKLTMSLVNVKILITKYGIFKTLITKYGIYANIFAEKM